MRKEATTLEELTTELANIDDQIKTIRDDINAKRRNLTELSSRRNDIENKIAAKKLEQLTEAISQKTGLSLDSFTDALKNGNVLVDHDNDNVSVGHTQEKENEI